MINSGVIFPYSSALKWETSFLLYLLLFFLIFTTTKYQFFFKERKKLRKETVRLFITVIHFYSLFYVLFTFSFSSTFHGIICGRGPVAVHFGGDLGFGDHLLYRSTHSKSTRERCWLSFFFLMNNPFSDHHQFSPYDIHRLSRDKVMRINKMITWEKCFDLLTNSLNRFFKEMYRDQFGEFVFVYWGLKG